MDDVFTVYTSNQLQGILEELHNFHIQIRFTVEHEKDGRLPFLDVLVCRRNDNSVSLRIYRKPTHTNRYLNWNSFHHPSHIISVADSLIRRAILISDPEFLQEELQFISKILISNNFPKHEVDFKISDLKRKLLKKNEVLESSSVQLILNTAMIEDDEEELITTKEDEYRIALQYLGPASHEIARTLWRELQ